MSADPAGTSGGSRDDAVCRKVSVTAPANIAFVKYWGARDVASGLPLNPSISMTLTACVSQCTVEPVSDANADGVYLADEKGELAPATEDWAAPIVAHLHRIRDWAGAECVFRVATRNVFPSAAGLASSASGFAALTLATTRAVGRDPGTRELSDLARRSGSGSAARSVLGGYVEWPDDMADVTHDRAQARLLERPEHWDLRDIVALVQTEPKAVSSREGHIRVRTSPYFDTRLRLLPGRLDKVRQAIRKRDFGLLRSVLEEEAVDLHFLAMSARPPIYYWTPATLGVLAAVRELGERGVAAGWTMDAGANVHVICAAQAEAAVVERLEAVPGVCSVIRDRVGPGPAETDHHLF